MLWPVDNRSLDDIATSQYGLVAREQLLAQLSVDQIEARIGARHLIPVRPAVYRLVGAPTSWEQRLLAVCLSSGAVGSHRSAARVWGIAGIPGIRLEVSVPVGRRVRLDGVRAHRSTLLRSDFVTVERGIPVTTVARTLVDLSAVTSDERVRLAVDDALRHDLVSLAELTRCFESLAGRGRRRVARFRQVLEARQPGYDPGDSELEARVARWLVAGGLPAPVAQHPVRGHDHRYRLDLAYPDLQIAIELDGWSAHGTRSAFDHDRARGNDLELAGWTLLRFTSASTRDGVVGTVRSAREAATSRTLVTRTPS